MKKPFKTSKLGKLLTSPVAKLLIKSIPFGIGSMAGNILDETLGNDKGEVLSPAGSVNRADLIPQLVKLAIYAILVYMSIKGSISWEDAAAAKELLGT